MDVSLVAALLDRFDTELPIEEARTPPSSWYLEADVFALERRAVFKESWQLACRVEQVAAPGDYVAGDVAGDPWLVVRGRDGELRAFHNVCRHHAALPCTGAGRLEQIVCPYHGWTYALDGRLEKAPRMGGVRTFARDRFGLVPMASDTWGSYVFVHTGGSPRSLAADMAPLAEFSMRADKPLRFAARRHYELACNWKVFVDNYLDGGYHVPLLHRGLSAHLDLDSYRTEIHERISLQTVASRDDAGRVGSGAVYAWVHPNLMLNRYGPVLDVNLVRPLAPDRCEVVFDYFFEQGVDDAFVARCLAESDLVQQEDAAISERVQAGLASSAYDVGRYAPRVEQGEHHFHRLLAAQLRAALAEPAHPA